MYFYEDYIEGAEVVTNLNGDRTEDVPLSPPGLVNAVAGPSRLA
jgi:hypothetical protein